MPLLQPTEEEKEQFRADPIAAQVRENWEDFDRRRLSMSSPIFRPANEWTSAHLAMVKCLTAHEVIVERIIPAQYIPPLEDSGER